MDRERSAAFGGRSVLESAERLGDFPYMGHVGSEPGTYEWVIPRLPYIVVYRVQEDEGLIFVDAVFHGAQDRDEE
jgi:toxin ParE1/3/4